MKQLPFLPEFLKARLSRRIVSWIFLSIVVIEAVILVPSVYRRERELLGYVRALSAAQAAGILGTQELAVLGQQELLVYLQKVQQNPVVLGGTLYTQEGRLVGSFGQPPQWTAQQIQQTGRQDRYWRRQDRYDALWSMSPLEGRYLLVIRHDVTWVQQEFFAFIARIVGLVLIIAIFVTLATLLGLKRLLIQPVLQLRQDLLQAGAAIQNDADIGALEFASRADLRQDELGDVIAAFEQMFGQITTAIATRKASEARFRTLVSQAADAFFVIDAEGRLMDVNQQACESLGYSRQDLLSLRMLDIQPDLTQAAFQQLWVALKPGLYLAQEGQHRRRDGTTFPVELRLGMVELGRQPLILALARDNTQRKKAEAAMTRLAEIGELAAMTVHEVRNPLTTVLLGLKSFQSLDLSERSQQRLSLALEEAERLQRLLSEILLYARPPTLELTELELNHWVSDLAPVIQALPVAEGRTLEIVPAAEPIYVQADSNKLKQVLINLLTNAYEAVAAGDTIICQVEKTPQHQALIQVKNGGRPIPEAVLPKLGQPFFTTKPSGNGLGLAVTRRIVDAHQGGLTIESSLELGTVVTVSLPALVR
ncbi:MAG: PAS domain S-box protein [Cyanobacteria bacterium Co-bin13]|nr:PAS domain S-box protein [Cyanobacteria bacterium Co-bin13]